VDLVSRTWRAPQRRSGRRVAAPGRGPVMPKTELAGYRMLDGRLNLQLFAQDKTEPPTPKRRRDARKKGQVAKSHDLGTALVLLIAFPVLYALIAYMGEQMAAFTYWTYTEALPLQE